MFLPVFSREERKAAPSEENANVFTKASLHSTPGYGRVWSCIFRVGLRWLVVVRDYWPSVPSKSKSLLHPIHVVGEARRAAGLPEPRTFRRTATPSVRIRTSDHDSPASFPHGVLLLWTVEAEQLRQVPQVASQLGLVVRSQALLVDVLSFVLPHNIHKRAKRCHFISDRHAASACRVL